jgi:hypothetical protein
MPIWIQFLRPRRQRGTAVNHKLTMNKNQISLVSPTFFSPRRSHSNQSRSMKNMTTDSPFASKQHPVHYKTIRLNELDIFYREAGPEEAPTILLMHGFPTSSNMFRNLIPRLASSFHVVAPDYPGFGQSSMPNHKDFPYTFENLTSVPSLKNVTITDFLL